MGWMAIKTATKDDTSPVRAAAVNVLVRDPDPATARTPSETTDHNGWIVRVAALEAVARRGDPSMLNAAEEHIYDKNAAVKFTASAAVIRIVAILESGARTKEKKNAKK